MSNEIRSTPALDKIIIEATSGKNAGYENMREQMLAALASENRIVRGTDGFGQRRIAGGSETDVPVSASSSRYPFEKEIRFHPESGKRALVIRATTLDDLIKLEKQILGEI